MTKPVYPRHHLNRPQRSHNCPWRWHITNAHGLFAYGDATIAYGSFEIAYAYMPFDRCLAEEFHRQSSSTLGVAMTLPYDGDLHGNHTLTRANIPLHPHGKKPASPFGKGGLCNQDRRLQAQVAYERREAGPGTSPPAPRDRPHRCRRACSAARRGRPCPR